MTVQELKKRLDKLMKEGFKDAPVKINGKKVSPIICNGWEFDRESQRERSYIDFWLSE